MSSEVKPNFLKPRWSKVFTDLWDDKTRTGLVVASIAAGVFAVGMAVSFGAAFLCIRWLLRYIASHDFTPFAWYRIAFGLMVLVTGYFGVVTWEA